MLTIGIIGIGKWGKNLIREFDKISNIKYCVSLGNIANKRWLTTNYPKIKYTNDVNELIFDGSINCIIISTPISTHFHLVKKALNAGKHVFVEKPLALNYIQTKNLINLAKRKKVVLHVGHIFLHHPIIEQIKKKINKEKIIYLKTQWEKFGTFNEDIIFNLLSHELSILLYTLGIPKKIIIIKKIGIKSKIDIIVIEAIFSKKMSCIIEVDRISKNRKKKIIIATDNQLLVWENDQLFKHSKKTDKFEMVFQSKDKPLEIECKTFIKNVKTKTNDLDKLEIASNTVKLCSKLTNEIK